MRLDFKRAGEKFIQTMKEERDFSSFIRYENQDKSTISKEVLAISQLFFELPSIWLDIFRSLTKASIKVILPKDTI